MEHSSPPPTQLTMTAIMPRVSCLLIDNLVGFIMDLSHMDTKSLKSLVIYKMEILIRNAYSGRIVDQLWVANGLSKRQNVHIFMNYQIEFKIESLVTYDLLWVTYITDKQLWVQERRKGGGAPSIFCHMLLKIRKMRRNIPNIGDNLNPCRPFFFRLRTRPHMCLYCSVEPTCSDLLHTALINQHQQTRGIHAMLFQC